MTIPDDVRDIIQDALYSYKAIARGIQDVTGESREDVLVAIDAACAWLDAQPEAPEKCYEPLETGEVIELDLDVQAEIGKWGAVTFTDPANGETMQVSFPPRYRICEEATK